MIDEKKLIETLDNEVEKDKYGIESVGIRRCILIVEEQPKVDRWIPCSERLPEKDGYYLATVDEGGSGYLVVRTEWYGANGWSSYGVKINVLAWMPLPEPWKGE